ncbi:MAG: carbohydrate ABC transporter permease [Alkaliphilus sp.]
MEDLKKASVHLLKHVLLAVSALFFSFPFIWMILGIFKTNKEIWQQPYKLLPYNFDFYRVIESIANLGFGRYILNSLFVGIVGSCLMILAAALFSYVIVFMKGKYTKWLFVLVLTTYMLPGAVTYVPSFVILARMGLLDMLAGLMLSNLASVFAVFYLRQSFLKMSYEYFEAALIDGASHLSILRHVVFSLNKSAFYTLFILTLVQQYNNYMWPSIILRSNENFLVSQALRQFFIQGGAYGRNWAEIMLASTIVIVPLIIVFAIGQKRLITGIAQDSGIK